MRFGVNFTGCPHLGLVERMMGEEKIDFCEIMIDNFLGVDVRGIADIFDGRMVAFHIMRSRFITRPRSEMFMLARRIKTLIEELRPIYVSDHLAVYEEYGRCLPILAEINYDDYDVVRSRVSEWQELLGQRLLVENFPSVLRHGAAQPNFLSRLCSEVGSGVLFDASNAVVANLNMGLPLVAWDGIALSAQHYHVAGYSSSGTVPSFTRDTHDQPISRETLLFLSRLAQKSCIATTMTVERDGEHAWDVWLEDIQRVRDAWNTAKPI